MKSHKGVDYSSQNLNGRDFSGCDLRGVNFARANLVGCNFEGSVVGSHGVWEKLLKLMALMAPWFMFLGGGMLLAAEFFDQKQHLKNIENGQLLLMVVSIVFSILLFVIGLSLRFLVTLIIGSVACVVIIFLAVPWLSATTVGRLVGGVMPAWGAVFSFVFFQVFYFIYPTYVGRSVKSMLVFLLSVDAFLFLYPVAMGSDFYIKNSDIDADEASRISMTLGASICITWFLWRVNKILHGRVLSGDGRYAVIAKIAILLRSIYGTSFANANLSHANFRGAIFEAADFRGAVLQGASFRKSIGIEWCITDEPWLIDDVARHMVVTGEKPLSAAVGKMLSGANLDGSEFVGLDMSKCNLGSASLRHSDLTNVNFSEVQLVDADLSYSNLSGSCVSNWLIGENTKLFNVRCTHVYMACRSGVYADRLPQVGDFLDGEFEQLYGKVVNETSLLFGSNFSFILLSAALKATQVETCSSLALTGISAHFGGQVVVKILIDDMMNIDRVRFVVDHTYRVGGKRLIFGEYEEEIAMVSDSGHGSGQVINLSGNINFTSGGGAIQIGGANSSAIMTQAGLSPQIMEFIAALANLRVDVDRQSISNDSKVVITEQIANVEKIISRPLTEDGKKELQSGIQALDKVVKGVADGVGLVGSVKKLSDAVLMLLA